MPAVTKVRKEWAISPRAHEHIEGVCTADGVHYTRLQVVLAIRRGEQWITSGGGATARIRELDRCSVVSGCPAAPYITTTPDHSTANNLDNLPPC